MHDITNSYGSNSVNVQQCNSVKNATSAAKKFLGSALCSGLWFTSIVSFADQPQEPRPEWEIGFGVGGQALADYRGSGQYQLRVAPFPLVSYNGKFFKADDEGMRGKLFASNDFEFNVNADLSLARDDGTDSESLRFGMPELLPTFEIGPDFIVNLSGDTVHDGWALHLPVRMAVATDLSEIDYAGWVFNPHFAYRQKHYVKGWDLVGQAGLLYSSERYNDYFYQVGNQFQTVERSSYDAEQGYSGAVFKLGLRRRFDQLWLSGSIRYDYLGGAVFTDSPLVENNHSLALSFGVGWYLWKSPPATSK